MSVREEERQKNNCPSRGLGIAAAAIGVGVGAALYYFFSKRPENPDREGSTSQQWSCEPPQTLNDSFNSDYTTISEHSTTDTSIFTVSMDEDSLSYGSGMETSECNDSEDSVTVMSDESGSEDYETVISDESGSEDYETVISDESYSESDQSYDYSDISMYSVDTSSELTEETRYLSLPAGSRSRIEITINSDSDVALEWDVTDTSIGVPQDDSLSTSPMQRFLGRIATLVSPRRGESRNISEEEQLKIIRDQVLNNSDNTSVAEHITTNTSGQYIRREGRTEEFDNQPEAYVSDAESDLSYDYSEPSIHSLAETEETVYQTNPAPRIDTTANSDSDVATERDVSSTGTQQNGHLAIHRNSTAVSHNYVIIITIDLSIAGSGYVLVVKINMSNLEPDDYEIITTINMSVAGRDHAIIITINMSVATDQSYTYSILDQMEDTGSNTISRIDIVNSDSDAATERDVSSTEVPQNERLATSLMQTFLGLIHTLFNPRRKSRKTYEEEKMKIKRGDFRERSWSLEECSICFDVMLKDQELMSLPCTHNFHVQCIGPWLQEQQTCPNCRKAAE